MTPNEIMVIVQRMCNTQSSGCRSLNKTDDARLLLNELSVPQNAEIWEIPVDWDNQVVVVFETPGDDNYYSLLAGIGTDGNYYFEVSVNGKITDGAVEPFENDDDIVVLPKDYFYKIFDYGEFFEPNSNRKAKTVYQDYAYNNDGFDFDKVGEVFFYSKEQGDKKMQELGLLGKKEISILSLGM